MVTPLVFTSGLTERLVLLILNKLQGWRRFQLLMILNRCRLICWAVRVDHIHYHFHNLYCGTVVLSQIQFLILMWTGLNMFICPSGHFQKVITIEECNVDHVEDYWRSVCASNVDPIIYLLYSTVPNTEQSVQSPGKCISIHSWSCCMCVVWLS